MEDSPFDKTGSEQLDFDHETLDTPGMIPEMIAPLVSLPSFIIASSHDSEGSSSVREHATQHDFPSDPGQTSRKEKGKMIVEKDEGFPTSECTNPSCTSQQMLSLVRQHLETEAGLNRAFRDDVLTHLQSAVSRILGVLCPGQTSQVLEKDGNTSVGTGKGGREAKRRKKAGKAKDVMGKEQKDAKPLWHGIATRPIQSFQINNIWYDLLRPLSSVYERNTAIIRSRAPTVCPATECPRPDMFCDYHQIWGHHTDFCWELVNQIRHLYRQGLLPQELVLQKPRKEGLL